MSDISIQPKSTGSSGGKVQSHSEAGDFLRAMDKVSEAKSEESDSDLSGQSEEGEARKDQDALTSIDIVPLSSQSYEPLKTLLPAGVSLRQEMLVTTSVTAAKTVPVTKPVNLEQLFLQLTQITEQPTQVGKKWDFTVQHSSVLSRISLLQTSAGQWSLSLGANGRLEAAAIKNKLDKLLKHLNDNGQNIRLDVLSQDYS